MSFVENKKVFFNYEILEKIEAGIELFGFEAKSVKAGKANISGAFVKIYNNEAWLVSCSISPFQEKNTPKDYGFDRARKLLLHKEEINTLMGKVKEKGLTLVPIKMYARRGKIKVELGLGKSKTRIDKREKIKKRDVEREVDRMIKRR